MTPTNVPASSTNFAPALTDWALGDLGTPRAVNGNDPAACPAPILFGTGKLSSVGGLPTVGWAGTPSVYTHDFHLTVANAVPNKPALGLYSNNPGSTPFFGGTLYLGAPVRRLPGQVLTALGGGAACGVALHDIDFRQLRVILVAVPQLIRHGGAAQV